MCWRSPDQLVCKGLTTKAACVDLSVIVYHYIHLELDSADPIAANSFIIQEGKVVWAQWLPYYQLVNYSAIIIFWEPEIN